MRAYEFMCVRLFVVIYHPKKNNKMKPDVHALNFTVTRRKHSGYFKFAKIRFVIFHTRYN